MNNVRPFVLAAVLLLLFLSTQSDWQQDKNGLESRRNVSRTTGTEKEVVKEKIIVELSSTNQKLEVRWKGKLTRGNDGGDPRAHSTGLTGCRFWRVSLFRKRTTISKQK
mmetsp:Transcript_1369/g.5258  ORF Transcript_1369/g.5258 Transcript_1369/m.5258 type:complete len:109 (+) Transcript_1369:214-540(+)